MWSQLHLPKCMLHRLRNVHLLLCWVVCIFGHHEPWERNAMHAMRIDSCWQQKCRKSCEMSLVFGDDSFWYVIYLCLYYVLIFYLPLSLSPSAISVELYYIFATVWGREAYTLYGILLVVFIILISVTACISIALTYFQLSTEDYRWWWRSIFSSGWASMLFLACDVSCECMLDVYCVYRPSPKRCVTQYLMMLKFLK